MHAGWYDGSFQPGADHRRRNVRRAAQHHRRVGARPASEPDAAKGLSWASRNGSAVVDIMTDWLAAADRVPWSPRHATQGEQLRHLATPVVGAMRRGRAADVRAKEACGPGAGCADDPGVIERIAVADGAAGWCTMIATTTSLFSHYARSCARSERPCQLHRRSVRPQRDGSQGRRWVSRVGSGCGAAGRSTASGSPAAPPRRFQWLDVVHARPGDLRRHVAHVGPPRHRQHRVPRGRCVRPGRPRDSRIPGAGGFAVRTFPDMTLLAVGVAAAWVSVATLSDRRARRRQAAAVQRPHHQPVGCRKAELACGNRIAQRPCLSLRRVSQAWATAVAGGRIDVARAGACWQVRMRRSRAVGCQHGLHAGRHLDLREEPLHAALRRPRGDPAHHGRAALRNAGQHTASARCHHDLTGARWTHSPPRDGHVLRWFCGTPSRYERGRRCCITSSGTVPHAKHELERAIVLVGRRRSVRVATSVGSPSCAT